MFHSHRTLKPSHTAYFLQAYKVLSILEKKKKKKYIHSIIPHAFSKLVFSSDHSICMKLRTLTISAVHVSSTTFPKLARVQRHTVAQVYKENFQSRPQQPGQSKSHPCMSLRFESQQDAAAEMRRKACNARCRWTGESVVSTSVSCCWLCGMAFPAGPHQDADSAAAVCAGAAATAARQSTPGHKGTTAPQSV